MIKTKYLSSLLVLGVVFLISCDLKKDQVVEIRDYVPVDIELYNSILSMDKVFFDAYNSCDLKTQAEFYSEDIEFFHDKGGLETSKQELLNSIERNICGKVTRELIEGSVEVYPIKDYGAVQIGFHKFFNSQEPDAPSIPSKFIIIWQSVEDNWKVAKVVSLH